LRLLHISSVGASDGNLGGKLDRAIEMHAAAGQKTQSALATSQHDFNLLPSAIQFESLYAD
jgi:hypothetical protein